MFLPINKKISAVKNKRAYRVPTWNFQNPYLQVTTAALFPLIQFIDTNPTFWQNLFRSEEVADVEFPTRIAEMKRKQSVFLLFLTYDIQDAIKWQCRMI